MWLGIGRGIDEFWSMSPYQITLTLEGYAEVKGAKKRKGNASDAQKIIGRVAEQKQKKSKRSK